MLAQPTDWYHVNWDSERELLYTDQLAYSIFTLFLLGTDVTIDTVEHWPFPKAKSVKIHVDHFRPFTKDTRTGQCSMDIVNMAGPKPLWDCLMKKTLFNQFPKVNCTYKVHIVAFSNDCYKVWVEFVGLNVKYSLTPIVPMFMPMTHSNSRGIKLHVVAMSE
jgi:hypothetical protein